MSTEAVKPQALRRPPGGGRVTLEHLAAATGLARTTISDIMNRNVGTKYSAETRDRVMKAVNELGYLPVRAAQQLARGRSGQIGLMLTRDFSNPFFARVADVVEREVRKLGYRLQMTVTDGEEGSEAERLRQLQSDAVEGLIIGPVYEKLDLDMHANLLKGSLPTVLFGGSIGSVFDEVAIHDAIGWRLAIQHLTERGHRNIAFLSAPPSRLTADNVNERFSALLELRVAGVFHAEWIFWQHDTGRFEDSLAVSREFSQRWLQAPADDRPTAVICHNDQVALTALSAFHEAGIRVPNDLSLIGCDNLPESAYLVPSLTSIDNHVDEQMRQAVNRLMARIESPGADRATIVVQPSLVTRGSVISVHREP
ncbi:MAG TPA: LacI family DNA-binding transcriptional regulator [Tepidisphaeraceae bacterium]|jgi:LacI family transcriptional regulator|nr:LacI family DNA-binding transcriptional regulator [Tepidisphaeraceae bacterium]